MICGRFNGQRIKVVSGEWRIAIKCKKFQRSARLAEWNVVGCGGVSNNKNITPRRTLWVNHANAPCLRLCSLQYCRRTHTAQHSGFYSVSQYLYRLTQRTGNPNLIVREFRIANARQNTKSKRTNGGLTSQLTLFADSLAKQKKNGSL